MNCVFCEILDAKIPAKVIEKTDHALAILDAFPLATGHSLVVSRSHLGKLQDLGKEELAAVFELVQKVSAAVEKATGVTATTIAVHNGKDAGQEIPHVHVHIIPRKEGDGAGAVHSMFHKRPDSCSMDMDSVCTKISSYLARH